ncbi:hypothetical protein BDB01DRAFT_786933 [Pilobolus umbonatus]|nr:hypothetical protein BDB01DRAFT_786933 [Pilobolus umbonatus]
MGYKYIVSLSIILSSFALYLFIFYHLSYIHIYSHTHTTYTHNMSDLNWCTYCDNAISHFSNSLYCSEECLRSDALNHHPLLGYDYAELKDFPRSSPSLTSSSASTSSVSPLLSPIQSYSAHKDFLPAFDLNDSSHSGNIYQDIYQQKHHKSPSVTFPFKNNTLYPSNDKKNMFFI